MEFRKFEFLKMDKEKEAEQKITNLADRLHDEWRVSRFRKETGDCEPRTKITKDKLWSEAHGGATEVDIANTRYEDLPSDWQAENKASAEVAVAEVEKAIATGVSLDDSFLELASSVLHNKWLERNASWASEEQKKPYMDLSEREKEKDRVIIRKAIEICAREK